MAYTSPVSTKVIGSVVEASEYNGLVARTSSSLLEYGCVGDGVTDNTTSFNNLLTSVGATYTKIIIPSGRYLIGSCTIPANIELEFAGGRIIWKSASTIVINAQINAGHKWIFENESEVVANLPTIGIHQQDFVSPVWFGLKMSGLIADATTNYNAFRSAWNAAYRGGDTAAGGSIKFPAGTCYMNPVLGGADGFQAHSKYAKISGVGKYKTIITSSSAGCLWDFQNTFDMDLADICLNGNTANGDNPLLRFGDYRIGCYSLRITRSAGNGIEIIIGQTNAIVMYNPTVTHCSGWGIVIDYCNGFAIDNFDIESCTLGAIKVSNSSNSAHINGRITGVFYGESIGAGIELGSAVQNIYVDVTAYVGAGVYAVKLLDGAYENTVILRAEDYRVKMLIEDNTYLNTVIVDENIILENSSDFNYIQKLSVSSPCNTVIGSNRGATYYLNNSNPVNEFARSTLDVVILTHNPINGILSYSSANNAPCSYRFPNLFPASEGNLISAELAGAGESFDIPTTEVYVQVLAKGKAGSSVSLRLFDQEDAPTYHYYDFPSKTWLDDANNASKFRLNFNGELQYFLIPITLGEQRELWFRFVGGTYSYDYSELYYFNITDSKDADLCHIVGGTVIGYGMDTVLIASTSLPTAANVPIGTKAFCTDLKHEVISDGTDWCKPDGTTLGA